MIERQFVSAMSPEQAYHYALEVDHRPSEDTRRAASRDPKWAYYYADTIDHGAHPVTRAGVGRNPVYSAYYTLYVDNLLDSPHRTPVPAYSSTLSFAQGR